MHWNLHACKRHPKNAYLRLFIRIIQKTYIIKEKATKINLIIIDKNTNKIISLVKSQKNKILNTKLYSLNSLITYLGTKRRWVTSVGLLKRYHQWRVQPKSQTVTVININSQIHLVNGNTQTRRITTYIQKEPFFPCLGKSKNMLTTRSIWMYRIFVWKNGLHIRGG